MRRDFREFAPFSDLMLDPKKLDPKNLPNKLLNKLEQMRRDKPFRYLGRRVVQGMAEAASANLLIGQRSAPGRYYVLRLVENEREKEEWERLFAESRAAIIRELERESVARDIKLRSGAEVDLVVLTDAEVDAGEAERVLASVLDPSDHAITLDRLKEERELVLARRVRTLVIESEPSEAQVYLDHRPLGVTPCRVEDVADGEHALTLSRPGYLLHEEILRIEPGRPGQKLSFTFKLEPEPEMGVLEVRTFPPRARVSVMGEARESPARWRIPAGPVEVSATLQDFKPVGFTVEVPPSPEERPLIVHRRLQYEGPDADEIVGRLVVYRPRTRTTPAAAPLRSNRISSFFSDSEDEFELPEWEQESEVAATIVDDREDEILGERPLKRGVILIGRPDPSGELQPDVRLLDAENSVTRGCHAWLWVYADRSTGAAYNTFLIGNSSPGGIRVDGSLVMETRRLSDASEIEIGNFRLRLVKLVPEARVEFGF